MVVAPHRDGGPAQFLQRLLPAPGRSLSGTCTWAAAQRLANPLSVSELARHAGWAPRTFARRFLAETGTTPQRWLSAERVLAARRLLEVTDATRSGVPQAEGQAGRAPLQPRSEP